MSELDSDPAGEMTAGLREYLDTAPLEEVRAAIGLPIEFWYQPEERPSHWAFGVIATVRRDRAATIIGILLPPAFGAAHATEEVSTALTRWSISGLHPAMERHLNATKRALSAARISRHLYDGAVREMNAAAAAWLAAFEAGLPGVRPDAALVRAEDIPALAHFGLRAGRDEDRTVA